MEVAASIVGLVAGTLTTVKACNRLLSAVKDGPEKLRHVTQAVSIVVSGLEQIKTSPDLSNLASTPSLAKIMSECKDDFDRFETRLNMKMSTDEKRHGVLWKRFKLAFAEKDLTDMLLWINGRVDNLMFVISIVQSRELYQLKEMSQRIIAHQETQYIQIGEQSALLLNAVNTQSDHLHTAVSALRLVETPSFSQSQADRISEQLQELEQKIAKLAFSSTRESAVQSGESPQSMPQPEGELRNDSSSLGESIRRLCHLVDNLKCTIESEDAADIVNDLDLLLRSAGDWEQRLNTGSSTGRVRQGSELNRIRGSFLSATDVKLNHSRITKRRPFEHGKVVIGEQQMCSEYNGHHGTLRFQRRIRRIRDHTVPGAFEVEECSDSVTLMPRSGGMPYAIKLSSFQRTERGLRSTLPPSLLISPVLPHDHPVFNCVRSGQLDAFRRLLSSKQAWLRARDPWGASLLHYAYKQPKICQFLLETGLDTDELADCTGVDYMFEGWYQAPLEICAYESGEENGEAHLGCFKQLLAVGADPTTEAIATASGQVDSPLLYSMFSDNVDIVRSYLHEKTEDDPILIHLKAFPKAILDELGTILDLNSLDYNGEGETFLHNACRNLGKDRVLLLLKHGADINAKDVNGKTCLFRVLWEMAGCVRPPAPWDKHCSFLFFLLKHGADVLARDNLRQSPSELAYQTETICGSSYVGDAWDSVLAAFGHDIAELRVGHPRRGKYCRCYSHETFKAIWAGKEQLCPYYEDDLAEHGLSEDGLSEDGLSKDDLAEHRLDEDGIGEYDRHKKRPHSDKRASESQVESQVVESEAIASRTPKSQHQHHLGHSAASPDQASIGERSEDREQLPEVLDANYAPPAVGGQGSWNVNGERCGGVDGENHREGDDSNPWWNPWA